MQNVESKALVPFKITLPMNWDILGPFSTIRCPNEINILKLEQLNDQMVICIYKGDLYGRLNTLGYCLLRIPQILKNRCNFTLRWLLDLSNTLEQNLRLKTLGYLLGFFYLLFGSRMADFLLLLKKQSHFPMLITAFGLSVFGPELTGRG